MMAQRLSTAYRSAERRLFLIRLSLPIVALTIFTDLQGALSPFVGGSTIAGAILGLTVVVSLFIALTWILSKGHEPDPNIFFFAAGFGIVFSVIVGWWDPWTIVFIALILVFVILKPFGSALGG